MHGGGHDFAILVHTSRFPNAPQYSYYASVADTTTGWYRNFQTPIAPGDYQWSQTGLHIEMPGLLWTGNAREMQLIATTPWGSLTARFTPTGPVLNYSGNAIVPLLDDVDYEYAFPTMRTTGTLTAEGRNFRISGSSWLDRQWGPVPLTVTSRWTWMNLGLSNGDQLALWDIVDAPAEHAWVTVLHPDGSYDLAAVTPVADGASDFWTSPATGKTYPMRWRVEIPSLRTRLDVRVAGPKGQEFPNGHVEATATVSGRAEGGRVSGTTFIEMAGAWTEHH